MAEKPNISIIYAFRNRDAQRVRLSLQSLQHQTAQGFEVVFVDYGSDAAYASAAKSVVESFAYASYHYIAHPGLLWNKSKALNYGISQAKANYVFVADVDVVFKRDFFEFVEKIKSPKVFNLFQIGYLPQSIQLADYRLERFETYKASHIHETFGVGLFPKEALHTVSGLDEFFHFYGSEDADLNERLIQAGYTKSVDQDVWMHHLWHPRYPQKKDRLLTQTPRLWNVLRLNQQHYLWQKQQQRITPQQKPVTTYYTIKDLERLQKPSIQIKLPNIAAVVQHFLEVELPGYTDEIVSVAFYEDPYYRSLKHRVKKCLGKQSQPYCSLKKVNDRILQSIVFKYSNHNYSYSVSNDLKALHWVIEV